MTRGARWCLAATAGLMALVPAHSSGAQSTPYMGTFTWSTALPSGDTKGFVDQYSWLGFTFEGDHFIRQNLSIGAIIGWQEIYHEDDLTSFDFETGTATGRMYKHLMVLPLLFRARYWSGTDTDMDRMVYPFAGLSVGTYRIRQTVDFGIITVDETHWHFGLAPEAGVLFGRRNGGVAWSLTARYNYPFNAGDYLNGDNAAWSYWSFALGVGFTPR